MERQALYFTGPRQVALQTEPLPSPAFGQVLVKTIMSAISPGTELLVYRGLAPADLARDETITALAGDFSFPLTYGYAAVGQVLELGPGVDPAWKGRLVFAFQPHVSHFIAAPDELLGLPAGLNPEAALFFPNLETAVNLAVGRPAPHWGTGGHLRPGHRGPALDRPYQPLAPVVPGDPGFLSPAPSALRSPGGAPEPGPLNPGRDGGVWPRLSRQTALAPGRTSATRSPAIPPPWTRPSPPPGSAAGWSSAPGTGSSAPT